MALSVLQQRIWWLSLFTVAYNLVEGVVSVGFGAQDETLALFGFGIDSFVETLSGIGIAHMVWRMQRTAVTEHDRFERQALRVTAVGFYVLAAGLVAGALYSLLAGAVPDNTVAGTVIAVISLAVMWWLFAEKRRLGKALNSEPILADASCTLTCIWMSCILLASSALFACCGWGWLDAVGSLGLAWFSLREGREAWGKAGSGAITCNCGTPGSCCGGSK
ncbi:MAG TPA: cation transporter [bacterium]|nr:cation transporter [bacterium]